MTTPRTPDSTLEATPREIASTTVTPPPSAAELAALRARLREVEVALGLPLRPGQAAPPDLPALRRRVAALERRAGIVPGLAPLPGCDDGAAPVRATTVTGEPDGWRAAWRERGRAALAAVALVAALAWLLRPLPGGPGFSPPAAPTLAAAGAPASAQAPVAVPASAPPCAFAEGCAREEPAPEPVGGPAAAPGEEQPARADYRAQHEGLSPDPPGTPEPPAAALGDDAARDDLLRQCRFGDVLCLPDGDATGGGAPACHGGGCLTP